MIHPVPHLPQPLRANETGTFTEDSVVRRLPEIASSALTDNQFGDDGATRIDDLIREIHGGVIVEIDEPLADDAADWKDYVAPYLGMTWLDVPWFFAETYFYRRLLAATGYSHPGPHRGVDPFLHKKYTDLEAGAPLAGRLAQLLDDLPMLLAASLWANRVDRSLWPASDQAAAARTAEVLGLDRSQRLLADDTQQVAELLAQGIQSVHVVPDNAGAELVADLMLAAHVLNHGSRVTIHVKPHPTFVSDVTLRDLDATIARLAVEPDPAPFVAATLRGARSDGRLAATTHNFWVSPLPFWECPSELLDDLADADLVIVKGDANYRRLLGDLHWDPTTPFSDIVRPLQPVAALRTAKSLVAAGLSAATVERASTTDPDWLTSGDWGMIQFAPEID